MTDTDGSEAEEAVAGGPLSAREPLPSRAQRAEGDLVSQAQTASHRGLHAGALERRDPGRVGPGDRSRVYGGSVRHIGHDLVRPSGVPALPRVPQAPRVAAP